MIRRGAAARPPRPLNYLLKIVGPKVL